MAEYSENHERDAARIAGALIEGQATPGFPEGLPISLPEGVSITDVQRNAIEFRLDLATLRGLGEKVPALPVGEGPPVPVSLRFSRMSSKYERISADQARESFFRRATDFLATRVAATSRWLSGSLKGTGGLQTLSWPQFIGGTRASILGCQFSVSSDTDKLAVYWSGAYYIAPVYFGYPTSPATGTLQSGTYIFGVNGGPYGRKMQWDKNKVCPLPGTPNVHLQY